VNRHALTAINPIRNKIWYLIFSRGGLASHTTFIPGDVRRIFFFLGAGLTSLGIGTQRLNRETNLNDRMNFGHSGFIYPDWKDFPQIKTLGTPTRDNVAVQNTVSLVLVLSSANGSFTGKGSPKAEVTWSLINK